MDSIGDTIHCSQFSCSFGQHGYKWSKITSKLVHTWTQFSETSLSGFLLRSNVKPLSRPRMKTSYKDQGLTNSFSLKRKLLFYLPSSSQHKIVEYRTRFYPCSSARVAIDTIFILFVIHFSFGSRRWVKNFNNNLVCDVKMIQRKETLLLEKFEIWIILVCFHDGQP